MKIFEKDLKKIIIIAISMITMITMFQGRPSYAGTTANTAMVTWDNVFYSTTGQSRYTNWQYKADDSSVKFRVSTMVDSLHEGYVTVRGGNNQSESNTGENCNYLNRRYYFNQCGYFNIYNEVHEKSFNYAKLEFRGKSGTGRATGYWSPDSNIYGPQLPYL